MPMVRPGSFAVVASLLSLAGLPGCNSAPIVRPAEAVPVVATESRIPSAGFRISLQVTNPSDEDVPIERFDYVFEVADVGRFEGRWAVLRTLPPGATETITIPASFRLPPDLPDRAEDDVDFEWRIDGGVRYQAPGLIGQILFDAGIRRPTEPFSGSGTFRLRSGSNASAGDGADSPADSTG